jgi:chemotaxis protein MotA
MKAATVIGIALGMGGILVGALMEGVNPASLIAIPSALIVLVGTAGCILASVGMDEFKKVPALYKIAFSAPAHNLGHTVAELVGFAERARRDGLLALENEVSEIDDAYMRKGLQLVVDGTDPEMLREILEAEIDAMSVRHRSGASTFTNAGAFAPTMGILGTVLSLLHVLGNLSAPETLGPMISGAFIATLYGVGAANLVFIPVGNRLKQLSEAEVEGRMLVLEGILAIQAGDNPRVVQEKLMSFVPPAQREAAEESAKSGAAATREPVPA